MEWIDVIQAISDGVMKGSTYAIIGIGFTLIFGVMHKLKLAYAAVSIAGAYASLTLINYFPETNVFIVFLMAVVVSGILGYLVYLLCFIHPAGKPAGNVDGNCWHVVLYRGNRGSRNRWHAVTLSGDAFR